MIESVIYGRDADKYIIINWLPSETDNRRQFFLLWVWVGGLGKSTLPQHVYNDPKIDNAKFDSKAWVRVSDNFHVLALTKTMLEAITDRKDDSGNLETIHKKLEKKLSGKKFLLVLDDVWNQTRCELLLPMTLLEVEFLLQHVIRKLLLTCSLKCIA